MSHTFMHVYGCHMYIYHIYRIELIYIFKYYIYLIKIPNIFDLNGQHEKGRQ